MNVIAMSLHNISTNLDFKSGENCLSPLGQMRRGHGPINFTENLNSDPEQ